MSYSHYADSSRPRYADVVKPRSYQPSFVIEKRGQDRHDSRRNDDYRRSDDYRRNDDVRRSDDYRRHEERPREDYRSYDSPSSSGRSSPWKTERPWSPSSSHRRSPMREVIQQVKERESVRPHSEPLPRSSDRKFDFKRKERTSPAPEYIQTKNHGEIQKIYYHLVEQTIENALSVMAKLTNDFDEKLGIKPEFTAQLKERLNERGYTYHGILRIPDDMDVVRQAIGKGGCYFYITTEKCKIDLIWHNQASNTIEFWGGKNNVINAMDIIRTRIEIKTHEKAYESKIKPHQLSIFVDAVLPPSNPNQEEVVIPQACMPSEFPIDTSFYPIYPMNE